MTKEKLIKFLTGLPPETDGYIIVMASDGEGNSFSPLDDIDVGLYIPDTDYGGEVMMGSEIEPDEKENCIVLWPTN